MEILKKKKNLKMRLNIHVLRLPKVGASRENGGESILENMLELVKHINLKLLFVQNIPNRINKNMTMAVFLR